MKFESFFDRNWLPRNNYFQVHRKRFLQSWEFLNEFLGSRQFDLAAIQGNVYDVGGDGPLSDFIVSSHDWELGWSDKDLRKKLPFEESTFDIIVCLEIIEHIKDQDTQSIDELSAFNFSGINSLLSELKRIIKPSGFLLITTPNTNSYINFYKWLHREPLVMDPGHVHEFTVDELLRVTREMGFNCEKLVTINSWDEHLANLYTESSKFISNLPGHYQNNREDNIVAVFSILK